MPGTPLRPSAAPNDYCPRQPFPFTGCSEFFSLGRLVDPLDRPVAPGIWVVQTGAGGQVEAWVDLMRASSLAGVVTGQDEQGTASPFFVASLDMPDKDGRRGVVTVEQARAFPMEKIARLRPWQADSDVDGVVPEMGPQPLPTRADYGDDPEEGRAVLAAATAERAQVLLARYECKLY